MIINRWIGVLVLSLGCGLLGGAASAEEDNDPHATGLQPPTAEHRAWERKNLIVTRRVRLNRLGLERVNAERVQHGQSALTSADVEEAPMGQETAGATAEAMASAPMVESAPAVGAPAALPRYVDNSNLKYFPPVRSQGSIGSCAQWSAMYYCFTHMNAMARDLDVKAGGAGNNAYIFSPKFTFNLLDGGENSGSYPGDGWKIAKDLGCATWQDWPTDNDFRGWPLTANVWRNAMNNRVQSTGMISAVDTAAGLAQLKTYLANGYVLSYGTGINSWQYKNIGDDPATTADDAFVGKKACYYANGVLGSHEMTVVGYNDDIWIDINGNGVVDPGEKGALRICNSWGPNWNGDGGFAWVAYDALKAVSAVTGGPSAGRQPVFFGLEVYWVTAAASYTPKVVAEFTVNHLKRDQLSVTLGIGDTSAIVPSTTWGYNAPSPGSSNVFYPCIICGKGGPYAFNGTTTAVDGTFALDFTSIMPAAGVNKRWFLGVNDNTAGIAATLKAFKLINCSNGQEIASPNASKVVDNGQDYAWVDWTYGGSANTPPSISNIADRAISENGSTGAVSFTIGDAETAVGSLTLTRASSNTALVPTANIVLSGTGTSRTVTATPAANMTGTATITLTVTDGGGLSASDSFVLTVNPVNNAPVLSSFAPANPATVPPGTTQPFSVSARDPDGDALSYAWQIDGAPAPGTLSSMNYSPLIGAAGSHTIKVTVSDGKGGSVSQIWNVTVTAPTNLPTITSAATATPNPANVGQSVTLLVAASNDANAAMTYSWDFGDSAHASGASATHAYAAAGTYTTTVTVSDTAGSVQSSVTVTVSSAISDTTDDHLGSITAQGDNAVKGEGMAQAFDNDLKTKWLDYAKSNPTTRASWIQYVYAPGISGNLTAYTITSANDYPSRDPRDWQLLGSNDGGATWTVVDSQGGQQFTARSQKRTFNLKGSPTYHAYRLNILRVWAPSNTGGLDGNSVQLSEIELLGVQVASVPALTANAPQTVAALKMSGTINTKAGVDASTLLGVLNLTPYFSAAGAQVHLDVNGATADFTLGKTGRAKNENGTFSLASKKGSTAAAFKAKLTKLGLNDIWGGKDVTPNGGTLSVTLKLDVNGQAYSIPLNLMVTSTGGEILKFKSQ